MISVIDAVILLFLLMGVAVGFKRGVIQSATMFVGAVFVIMLSYTLKNPVAKLLYSIFPFFKFGGDFEGLSVLNIIIYEAIAFLLVYIVLMILLQILVKITGGIEKILKFTIILGIPSKLLGGLFGLFESYIFVFIGLFLLSQFPTTNTLIQESKLANPIVDASPILSNYTKEYYQAVKEIISMKDQNKTDKNEYNLKSLDILLKYDIVDINSVEDLIASGKLEISNVNTVLDKYRKES